MPFNFGIEDEFSYYGVRYRVHSIEPPMLYMQRLDGDGKMISMELITLISNPNFLLDDVKRKKVEREKDRREQKIISLIDKLPEEKKSTVFKRYEMIKPILLFEKVEKGDFISVVMFNEKYPELIPVGMDLTAVSRKKLIEQISERNNISERQIRRYLDAFKKADLESPTNGVDGLVLGNELGRRTREDEYIVELSHPKKRDIILDTIKLRIDKAYGPVIKKAVEKYYLSKRKPNIAYISELIEVLCRNENLKKLGYDTIYSIVKRIDKKIVNILRDGDEALEKYQLNEMGFSRNAKTPLHIIEIDHTLLDIDVIDETSGVNMGRPWITMGIDVFSRQIWCMHISFDAPSANKVRKAIEHGLFFKNAKEKYGTNNEWEICGVPQIIYVDNGPDFKSADVSRIINEGLNIQVMYRPVKLPRYGAIIERVFGTINRRFIHNLKGTRKSNPKDLGQYDAEKEAIFTLADIKELLTIFIVDVYHHEIHKGLPLEYPTPAAMLYHGIDMFGFPDFIEKDEEDLYTLKLMAQDIRKYNREGIRKDNVIYHSKETSNLITYPLSTYKIKYDIDDISYVYILVPETGEYKKIFAQNPTYDDIKGMNRKTYKLILKELREQGKINLQKIPGSKDITLGKKLLQEKLNRMMKNNKKLRNTAIQSGFSLTTTSMDIKGNKNNRPKSNETISLIERLNYERKQQGGKNEE